MTSSNRYNKPTVAKAERSYYQSQIWLRGSYVEDIVCLVQDENCVDPFPFLGVSQQKGLPESVMGIMGFALGNNVTAQDENL